jgi:glycerol dehydrogenase-like iron-containing ADH family enzyme
MNVQIFQYSQVGHLEQDVVERQIAGCMRLNTICLPAGHFHVEEGSEHYLFYELEERLQRLFTHSQIVGLGIYLMSRLQGNNAGELTASMMDQ